MTFDAKHDRTLPTLASPTPAGTVGAEDWNAAHQVRATGRRLLGRATPGVGPVEALLPSVAPADGTLTVPAGLTVLQTDRFTANGVWEKHPNAVMVLVQIAGGGASGGGGGLGNTSGQRSGGAGGSCGVVLEALFPAAVLGDTESVVVGAAVAGGLGSTTYVSTSTVAKGAAAQPGNPSAFGNRLWAPGGIVPGTGNTDPGTALDGGFAVSTTGQMLDGGDGNPASAFANPGNSGGWLWNLRGPGGGAGGAGFSSGSSGQAAGAAGGAGYGGGKGLMQSTNPSSGNGGTAGTAAGNGGAGTSRALPLLGDGGGSGGSGNAANGGDGGDGGTPGGGGGGGGASHLSGGRGGNGGAGARGEIRVVQLG